MEEKYYKSYNIFKEKGGSKEHYYYFKKKFLPRIEKVIGVLQGIEHKTILDIGSQRGSFLWNYIDTFPENEISVLDISEKYNKVHKTVLNEKAYLGDIKDLSFLETDSFDIITCLEVLEHIDNYELAIKEIMRVAKDYVIISVPSKKDNNPEHINFFTHEMLLELFASYPVKKIGYHSVLNHRILLIKIKNV